MNTSSIPKRDSSRTQKVGELTQNVIDLLAVSHCAPGPIMLGPSNVAHMQSEHPDDLDAFFELIPAIIQAPTYVALHPNGKSIEYIKVLQMSDGGVLLAVRVSRQGTMFARSLYKISEEKLESYLASGTTRAFPR